MVTLRTLSKGVRLINRSILLHTEKQCAFHENCTKRSFQVMRSTVWPNRIFVWQSSRNRHNGLNFWPKQENSTLSLKIIQNEYFRSFGHVLAISHFGASLFSKSWNWAQILFKTEKQCGCNESCTKRFFTSCAARFGQIAVLTVKVLKIVTLAWISIQKAETVRFFIKILQNALFRSVAARFGQIAFLSVKVLKMVKLASNSLQNGKTVRFPWKLYKTLFSGHQHVLAKSQFWPSKFLKTSPWPEILLKKGKQCAFH